MICFLLYDKKSEKINGVNNNWKYKWFYFILLECHLSCHVVFSFEECDTIYFLPLIFLRNLRTNTCAPTAVAAAAAIKATTGSLRSVSSLS